MKQRIKLNLTEQQRCFLENVCNKYYVNLPTYDDIYFNDVSFLNDKILRVCQAVLLYDKTQSIEEVSEKMGLNQRTIYYYLQTYRKDHNFMKKLPKRNVSELQKHFVLIRKEFNRGKIKTYKQAQEKIEELTGIKRGITQIRAFLNNNYFKKDKNGYIKCKYNLTIKKIIYSKIDMANSRYKHSETTEKEMEEYAYRIASSCNYNMDAIAEKFKEKFDLFKTNEEVVSWLEKHTTL